MALPQTEASEVRPNFAIALLVGTRGGLALNYSGIRRFDLSEMPLEKVVSEVASPDYGWKEPEVGKLRTALSIRVDKAEVTLIFVLDPGLQAEFADKPILTGCERSQQALSNVQLWPQQGDSGGARIASVDANSSKLEGEGDVKFNLAVVNVGELGKDCQRYATPIFIDPDYPWPHTGTGVGGGGPP